jgi:hypothetical protein
MQMFEYLPVLRYHPPYNSAVLLSYHNPPAVRSKQLTVAALIIEPLGVSLCGGTTRELLRLLCLFPQQFLTHVVQYLAMQR